MTTRRAGHGLMGIQVADAFRSAIYLRRKQSGYVRQKNFTPEEVHNAPGRRSQFIVRGRFSLTTAFALWFVVLPGLRSEPIVIAILWTLAIIGGVCGHPVYTHVFPWRCTVVIGLMAFVGDASRCLRSCLWGTA